MNTDDPPHVAILMATCNGGAHLAAQLDSIARQSHRDWSLWVSDDGSTDDTLAILQDFALLHPVTVVAGPRRGSSAANFLSLLCHPDLPVSTVALADQDDVWLDGKLSRALRRMARARQRAAGAPLPEDAEVITAGPPPAEIPAAAAAPHADHARPVLYAAESMLTDDRLTPLAVSQARGARPCFANALVQNLFGGHTTVMNAAAHDLIRRAGQQDGIAFHDWWIYQLVAGAGGTLLLDRRPMAMYRQHDGNALGGSARMAGMAKRVGMTLRRDFARMMEAQAEALWQVSHLLTPDARATLDEFRRVPRGGPQRVAMLRRLGIQRASRAGQAAFLTAALFGRM